MRYWITGFSDAFEVTLPVERTAPGRPVQFRLVGEARRLWAPGMLGVTQGAAAFMPAKEKHSSRAWRGDVESFEVGPILHVGSYLRLHTPEGPSQFATQLPPKDLEARVGPLLSQRAVVSSPPPQAPASRAAADSDAPLDTNLRTVADSPQRPRPGDIFVLAPADQGFLFGRVISTHAQWTRAEGPGTAVLIYLYSELSASKEIPEPVRLGPDRLLVPPLMTNELPWRHGLFQTLDNVRLDPQVVLQTHCFRAANGLHFDGFGRELPGPIEPVGRLSLHSARSIDDTVSDALGLPRAR